MKAGLTIGELAGELQLNPKTIRYYEEVGLLPEPVDILKCSHVQK